MSATTKVKLIDVAERAGATFYQAFFAGVTLGHTVAPAISDKRSVELAALAGVYSVGKWLFAQANAYLANPPSDTPTS